MSSFYMNLGILFGQFVLAPALNLQPSPYGVIFLLTLTPLIDLAIPDKE